MQAFVRVNLGCSGATSSLIPMSTPESYDIAVGPDGSISLPADAVARMVSTLGDHLRLVRDEAPAAPPPHRMLE